MGINKENYEAYFLDYQEGTLAPEQVAELMVFLEVYPDLKEDLESFELVNIEPDSNIQFENKNLLKRKTYLPTQNINSNNYEEWLVAEIEGDLSAEDKAELKDFLKINPTAKLELNIFMKTFLKPEPIVYENKKPLKKRGIFLLYTKEIIYATSIAASVLLFLGLYFTGDFKINKKLVESDFNMQMQSKQFSKLKTGNVQYKEIPLSKISETSFDLLTPVLKNHTQEINSISSLATIRYTSSLQIENTDIYYISKKYGASYTMNEVELADLNDTKNKSFIGRFLSSSASKLIPSRNPSGKSLLEYSVEGYNLLADREVEVEKQYDSAGKVVAYNVNGDIINFSHKVKSTPQN